MIRAAKAGAITHSQSSFLEVTRTTAVAGQVTYNRWVSSESGFDGLRILIDLNNNGTYDFIGGLGSAVPPVATGVSYPAAYPESIAVGATSNFDCRSHYSQYGPELDLVAPSSGGFFNLGIDTTDRMGSPGYTASSYFSGFGGTSSATPLVAGIAGLMLSRNPYLTAAEVRQILQNTTDRVGSDPYPGGRNDRYGFGRVNAHAALLNIIAAPQIQSQPGSQIVNAGQTAFLWVSAIGSNLAYQWYLGPSGTTTNPIGGATASSYTTPPLNSTAQYWVRVSNAAREVDSHTATITVRPVATLISPSGTITTPTPTFTWAAVGGATEYLLWVNDASQQARIDTTYTPAAVACASGTGTCTVSPGVTLAQGAAMWWIKSSPNISGEWSSGMAFSVPPSSNTPPGPATLVAPSGTATTTTPSFTWQAVSGATEYQLWVNDASQGPRSTRRIPRPPPAARPAPAPVW